MSQTYSLKAIVTEFPTGLQTAEAIAEKVSVPAKRLIELADDGFAPHWRIDEGEPLFKASQLKAWLAANLMQHHEGAPLPDKPINIVLDAPPADPSGVPLALRNTENLRDITHAANLPSGIYFLCQDKQIQYIGQSVSVASRINEHLKRVECDRVFLLPWPRDDLNRIEGALIRHLKPPLNKSDGPRWTGNKMHSIKELQQVAEEVLCSYAKDSQEKLGS